MAYQPIQAPHGGLGAGIDQLAAGLGDLASWQRQQRIDAEERRRQGEMDARLRRQDMEGLVSKAHELYRTGRKGEAMALLKQAGAGAQEVTEMRDIPGVMTEPAQPQQGGSAVPDQLDQGRSVREIQDRDPDAAAVMPGSAAPRGPDADLESLMQRAEAEKKPDANPIVAAADFNKGRQAQRAANLLRVSTPGGGSFDIDPAAERETRMQRVDAAFKDVDPQMAKMYGQIRPILAMSDQEVNPRELFLALRAQMQTEGQQTRDEARREQQDKTLAQQAALRREGIQQSDTNNRRMTGAMIHGANIRGGYTTGPDGTAGPRELAEAGTVVKELDEALKPFAEKGGIRDRLAHADAAIDSLRKNPDNPTNWVNAIDAAIRTNTGRAAILSQYKLYTGHSAGTDDQLHQWAEQFLTGAPSAAQKKNLYESFIISRDELRDEARRAQGTVKGYEEDPRVKRNRSAAEALTGHMRGAFGTVQGLTPEQGAQQTSAPAPGAPPKGGKSNRLTEAAAATPEDREAIRWAKGHPDDPRAKQILQMHGM